MVPDDSAAPTIGNGTNELWVHALAAKVGGGLTYLHAVVPELIAQLEGRNVRLILLLPEDYEFEPLPWVSVYTMTAVSGSPVARIIFDQVLLPIWLAFRPRAALFCSGNFAPVAKPVATVVLVRNAIYFDKRDFLDRERWSRRLLLRLQGALIRMGARGCASVHFPSQYMRRTFESSRGPSAQRGRVNYYGIGRRFSDELSMQCPEREQGRPYRFLMVMNYTLQKNLSFVLRALAKAKAEGLQVRVTVTSKLANGPRVSRDWDRHFIASRELVESGHLELAGPLYGRELIDMYLASDGCLMPSFCESFAHPLVEAMSLGKPLICADRPFAREICGDGALYVDPERPEELVRLWWDWPAPLIDVRPRTRAELLRTFSWSAHVARLLDDLGVQPV